MAGRPPKSNTTNVVVENDNDELKKQNEALQEQLKQMQEQMTLIMQNMTNQQTQVQTPTQPNTSVDRWVDIIHLRETPSGGSTHIEIPSRTIDFYKFGEVRSIRYNEFQELVGKYKSWFDKNIIAISEKDADLAEKEGLGTNKDIILDRNHISSLPNLPIDELERLYLSLSEGHKLFITRMWAYGYYESGEEYRNISKVELLNRLSNGAMENILKDLTQRR